MKIFYLPTIKVSISHLWSCDHLMQVWTITILVMWSLGRQRKAKMNKSTIGQQSHLIKIKADKTNKRWKYFTFQPSRCTISHLWSCDHMIQVWTINILVMRTRGRTEKRKNEQKHRRTTAPGDKNQGGQNTQKMKIFYYSNHQGERYPNFGHVIT